MAPFQCTWQLSFVRPGLQSNGKASSAGLALDCPAGCSCTLYCAASSAAHSICAGLSRNCRVAALKSLIELFLKSCFEKQPAAGAALEAMALQMSGNRCRY